MNADLLLLRSGRRLCALAVAHVEETMRPLPIEPLPDVPSFVRGASIVRGAPTPIVDLRTLLGDAADGPAARLVTVRTPEGRRVGLLVDDVVGVRARQAVSADELPPLLRDAAAEVVEQLGRLDGALLTVLRAGNLLPDDVRERIMPPETPP